jgi:hypothetical protein
METRLQYVNAGIGGVNAAVALITLEDVRGV